MRSVTLITLLLLLGISHNSYVRANDYSEVFDAVGECFDDDSASQSETLACLSEYTDCFDSNSLTTIETCVSEANATATASGTTVDEELENCLLPYAVCIQTEMQAIIDSLPACMNTTITDLGNCYIDNASTCNSTCSDDDIPNSNPYASASATSILVCQAFQSDIMDPTCAIVDCCQPCMTQFEAFMNCIAQDALNLKTAPPQSGDCEVSCPSARRRALKGFAEAVMNKVHRNNAGPYQRISPKQNHRALEGHMAEKPKAEGIYALCAKLFETATTAASSGSGGTTPPAIPAELAVNVVEGLFQQCVIEQLFDLTEEYATPTSSPTDSGSGATGMKLGSMVATGIVLMGSLVAF